MDARGFLANPYASEQPQFTITAQNVEQYKDKLAPGQYAMFKRYPDTFKMPVYPTHRGATVPADVYDAFAEKLKVAVAKLKIGNGLEDGTTTGPLIDEKAVAKVQEHIADALSKGATLLAGGKVMEGNFFEPTILTNVPKNAAVAKEETFGPLAPLFRFKDEAEVIAMSNDTEFGLASYFYARDLGRVFRVAEALEYGMVGVNTGLISNEVAPFGGIKASGLGREGSKYGIEDYLEIKYLCLGI